MVFMKYEDRPKILAFAGASSYRQEESKGSDSSGSRKTINSMKRLDLDMLPRNSN